MNATARRRQCTVHVSGITDELTEDQLAPIFNKYGKTVSVRICRDPDTCLSHGYGYVQYHTRESAQAASRARTLFVDKLKLSVVAVDQRKGHVIVSGENLTITGLECQMERFGRVIGVKMNGSEAIVTFQSEEQADKAVKLGNGLQLFGMGVVGVRREWFVRVSGILGEIEVRTALEEHGEVLSFDITGKGCADVMFASRKGMDAAIAQLDGEEVGGGRVRIKAINRLKTPLGKPKRRIKTLFVKNIDPQVTNLAVNEVFSAFGKIAPPRLRKPTGNSTHPLYTFINFVRSEDAEKAFKELQGKIIGDRPILIELEKPELKKKVGTRKTVQPSKKSSSSTVSSSKPTLNPSQDVSVTEDAQPEEDLFASLDKVLGLNATPSVQNEVPVCSPKLTSIRSSSTSLPIPVVEADIELEASSDEEWAKEDMFAPKTIYAPKPIFTSTSKPNKDVPSIVAKKVHVAFEYEKPSKIKPTIAVTKTPMERLFEYVRSSDGVDSLMAGQIVMRISEQFNDISALLDDQIVLNQTIMGMI